VRWSIPAIEFVHGEQLMQETGAAART
jgi:hypothetical protein